MNIPKMLEALRQTEELSGDGTLVCADGVPCAIGQLLYAAGIKIQAIRDGQDGHYVTMFDGLLGRVYDMKSRDINQMWCTNDAEPPGQTETNSDRHERICESLEAQL